MSTEIVRWQDTPRVYVVEATEPKRKGLPKRKGWLDIGQRESVAVLVASAEDYASRTGYAIVGMFPHTLPESFKPKAKVKRKARKTAKPKAIKVTTLA